MAHLRDVHALTLEGAKAMAVSGMTSPKGAEVAAAGVAAFRGSP
jgi:hypothetical protein